MSGRSGKLFFAFILLFAVLLFLPVTGAEAPADQANIRALSLRNTDLEASDPGGVLVLPSSLLVIEDGAFEGTAFSAALLPDTVQSIGDRAFACMPGLHVLNMPDSLSAIGRDAFLGSEAVTLLGSPDSMARAYAEANGVPFQAVEEALPVPQNDPLLRRADFCPALFLLLAFLIVFMPRMSGGSIPVFKPLRWRKRAELHPLNLCFP